MSSASTAAVAYGGGNDFTSARHTIRRGATSKSAMMSALLKSLTIPKTFRHQAISNFDTNMGQLIIRNAENAGTGAVEIPMHFYDISSLQNQSTHAPGWYSGWTSTATTASPIFSQIGGQTATGATLSSGIWCSENGNTSLLPNVDNAFHDWTSVKLLLYGARKRSTFFDISFVTFKNDDCSPLTATTGAAIKQCIQQLSRPYIYTTIQSDQYSKGSQFYKVLKTYRHTIAPSQTTDIDTSTGKCKQVNIFFKHNKRLDLNYVAIKDPESDILGHAQDDGRDYGNNTTCFNHPTCNQRVVMIIRAFAPERASAVGDPPASADRDPSYDIVLRNRFTVTR